MKLPFLVVAFIIRYIVEIDIYLPRLTEDIRKVMKIRTGGRFCNMKDFRLLSRDVGMASRKDLFLVCT